MITVWVNVLGIYQVEIKGRLIEVEEGDVQNS
jgi:hypothetical protein